MSNYVVHETYAVCSMQSSMDPGTFAVLRDFSVKHESKRAILNVDDIQLKEDFSCKNDWTASVGIGFFAAGLALALVVAFTVVTLGVGAIIIAGAVAIVASIGIKATFYDNKCNPQLEAWYDSHPTVNVDGKPALTKQSFMKCSAGGILTPFFDKELAERAAFDIADRNRSEIIATAVIAGLFGFGVGEAAAAGYVAFKGVVGSKLMGVGGAVIHGAYEYEIGVLFGNTIFKWANDGIGWSVRKTANVTGFSEEKYDRYVIVRDADPSESSFGQKHHPNNGYLGQGQIDFLNKDLPEFRKNKATFNNDMQTLENLRTIEGTKNQKKAQIADAITEVAKTAEGQIATEEMKQKTKSGPFDAHQERPLNKGINRGQASLESQFEVTKSEYKAVKRKAFTGGQARTGLILPFLLSPITEFTLMRLAELNNEQSDVKGGSTLFSQSY